MIHNINKVFMISLVALQFNKKFTIRYFLRMIHNINKLFMTSLVALKFNKKFTIRYFLTVEAQNINKSL
jgi:hypothetical protein